MASRLARFRPGLNMIRPAARSKSKSSARPITKARFPRIPAPYLQTSFLSPWQAQRQTQLTSIQFPLMNMIYKNIGAAP